MPRAHARLPLKTYSARFSQPEANRFGIVLRRAAENWVSFVDVAVAIPRARSPSELVCCRKEFVCCVVTSSEETVSILASRSDITDWWVVARDSRDVLEASAAVVTSFWNLRVRVFICSLCLVVACNIWESWRPWFCCICWLWVVVWRAVASSCSALIVAMRDSCCATD